MTHSGVFLPESLSRPRVGGAGAGIITVCRFLAWEAVVDRHFLHRRPHLDQAGEVDVGERARVLAELADGRPLTEVMDREAQVVDGMLVRELLEALPGVDKIHAGQLMRGLGIADRRAVRELSERQRRRLRELFPPSAAA
jgi:hypothetical protein